MMLPGGPQPTGTTYGKRSFTPHTGNTSFAGGCLAKRGSFPLKGSNWFARPSSETATEAEWKADVALLNDTHRTLREAIAGLSSQSLHYTPPDSKFSNLALITGIASHDLYHAGQIQLLKRLGSGARNELAER